MSKQRIIDYVMNTPGNTNPNILNTLLDEEMNNKFIVTLTPIAEDFSGTMDKTPQEITAAHEAGQEIVFNIVGYPSFDSVQINADWFTYATGRTYCAACATLVDLVSDMQIGIFTADIADTKTYDTRIYPLTPAT